MLLVRQNVAAFTACRALGTGFPVNVYDLGNSVLDESEAPWHNDSGDDCSFTD